jgi:hypothetical protein
MSARKLRNLELEQISIGQDRSKEERESEFESKRCGFEKGDRGKGRDSERVQVHAARETHTLWNFKLFLNRSNRINLA